ncbi:MAG TPA: response regulator [Steroidobacteraceae bacterium]|nr:response regulator [Steroidobacteraceae bacterium]
MNTAESNDPATDILSQHVGPRREGDASIIANEIDIAMSPISLYADALLERKDLDKAARQYVTSIRRAADDVALAVARLRALDRPHTPAPEAPESRKQTPAPAVRSLRVLLIDDDPSLIESLRSALVDEGHKVTTANGGQAGIDAFRAASASRMPYDIVITDLAMPDVDGRQVVASLRAASPGTPIVLLTGWRHQLADRVERPLQVDRLLGKPPRIRELRAALAELTGRRATDRLD